MIAPAVPQAAPQYRAYLIMDVVPAGCAVFPVTNRDLWPHLRPGEFAIIETADIEPAHGELYAIQWQGGRQALCQATRYRPGHLFYREDREGWRVGSLYREHSVIAAGAHPAAKLRVLTGWSEGPLSRDALSAKLMGRVVGILGAGPEARCATSPPPNTFDKRLSRKASTMEIVVVPSGDRTLATDILLPGESARRYARASKSDATLRAYTGAVRSFEAWCRGRGLAPVPADIATVVDFLSAEADAGRKVSSIAQKAAAIRWAHKTAGFPSPTEAEAVQSVMKGIRRAVGVAPKQKAPATAERIIAILAHVPADTLIGKRDRALLLLGFAGAFRRSELAGLQLEDLTFGDAGVDVLLRRSKTDQEGVGQHVAIPHGVHLRPVEALQGWIAAADITSGPLFRSVTRRERLGEESITGHTVALVVKRYAAKAGLRVDDFSGHSLRAGFVTSAADRGADINRIMDVSRHVDPRTVRTYIRLADRYKDHAGAAFL